MERGRQGQYFFYLVSGGLELSLQSFWHVAGTEESVEGGGRNVIDHHMLETIIAMLKPSPSSSLHLLLRHIVQIGTQ